MAGPVVAPDLGARWSVGSTSNVEPGSTRTKPRLAGLHTAVGLARYQAGGLSALAARPVPGRPARLSRTQCERLYGLIVGGGPREFGLGPALWTRDRVRALIARDLHVTLSEASVGRVLRGLGIAAPRPQVQGCVAAMLPVRPPDILLYAGASVGPVRFGVYPGPVGEWVHRDFLARLRQGVGATVSVSWNITVDNGSAYL